MELISQLEENSRLLDLSDIWESDIDEIFYSLNEKMAVLPLVKSSPWPCFKAIIHKYFVFFFDHDVFQLLNEFSEYQLELIDHGFEDNAKWKPQ